MNIEMENIEKRSDLHLSRKIWHIATVSMMTVIYVYTEEKVAFTVLLITMLISIPLDFARQFYSPLNEVLVKVMRPFIRRSEVHNLAGTTYLLTGVATIALFFPRHVIELTMMFLAFADPIASYFGVRYGKDKIWGQKSLQGFAAAFVICCAISAFYFYWTNLLTDRLVLASLATGFIGAISELIQVGELDDNFTLPIISASLLSGLFFLFGIFS